MIKTLFILKLCGVLDWPMWWFVALLFLWAVAVGYMIKRVMQTCKQTNYDEGNS